MIIAGAHLQVWVHGGNQWALFGHSHGRRKETKRLEEEISNCRIRTVSDQYAVTPIQCAPMQFNDPSIVAGCRLASFQLLQIPSADLNVALVFVQALCELFRIYFTAI